MRRRRVSLCSLWRNRLLAAGLACLLLGIFSLPAPAVRAQPPEPAAGEPAALENYIAALQEARQALAGGADLDTALTQARSALAPIRQVLLPSGVTVTIEPLLGGPGEPLADGAALARVETVLAQLQAASGDDTAARLAALSAVLAGPQFVAGDSWWDIFLRWLVEWLDRILPESTGSPMTTAAGGAAGDILWMVVGIGGAAALVLLLAWWLRGFLGSFIGDAQATADSEAGDLPQTPAEARRRAAELAASGDYRDAVRNLYLSALLTLEQNGVAPADRSLTNRELLRRVQAGHPVRPHLQPVVETFDDVWYGVHEPDSQTYSAYTHSIDELETLARRPAQEAQP